MHTSTQLTEIYDRLFQYYGAQNWWPAESKFEMIVGAVLTQNTNWQNVRKAINSLRAKGLLSFSALYSLPADRLALFIKSCGYYNLKAKRLKNLLQMIHDVYDSSLEVLLDSEPYSAREALLSVKGIGPETADSILLYAGGHPIFVVDAYTHRIFSRHNLAPEECDYQSLQDLFMDNLPRDSQLFNEYHALVVVAAKQFCKKNKPLCDKCPLEGI